MAYSRTFTQFSLSFHKHLSNDIFNVAVRRIWLVTFGVAFTIPVVIAAAYLRILFLLFGSLYRL